MDRLEALKMLDLAVDATPAQIEQRYELLLRRYRHASDDASQTALTAATKAYESLRAVERPALPVDPRSSRKILGRTWADWANRWHYDKWIWLGSVAAIAFIIYVVVTIITNRPADLKIVTIGNFTFKDETVWQEQVSEAVQNSVIKALQPNHPEIDHVDYEPMPIAFNADGSLAPTNDPTTQQNMLIKVVARIGADTLDVLILDRGAYAAYASQAQFADLSPLVTQLQAKLPPAEFARIEQLHTVPEGDPAAISGLDITALNRIGDFGLKSASTVVVIGPRSRDAALAAEWLYAWLSSSTS